jgi:hypothetical protein
VVRIYSIALMRLLQGFPSNSPYFFSVYRANAVPLGYAISVLHA